MTLGTATGAIINGGRFQPPGALEPDSPRLAGALRFDAPTLLLPPLDGTLTSFSKPFTLTGQVVAFAAEDVAARLPLFEVALTGKGTARAAFDTFGSMYGDAEITYTCTPGPAADS